MAAGDFNGDGIDELAVAVDRTMWCRSGFLEVRRLGGYDMTVQETKKCDAHFGFGLSAADLDGGYLRDNG